MKFAKKSLGQNFLIDKNIASKIVNLVDIKKKDVIEIGPGKGFLTDEILKKKPNSITLIEKDDRLSDNLKIKYQNYSNIEILNFDILKFNLEKIVKKNSIIIGNLPYNISSQILVKILKFKKWPPDFSDIIFMFQKELADKISGKFLSSSYGRLSIFTSYRLNIRNKFLISPNCFVPKPKVTSQIIHFIPKNEKQFIKDLNNLEKVTNILFSNKRKMINKKIIKILDEEQIKKIEDLKLHFRPSQIRPEVYYKITEFFEMNL